jgi:hypothetical protein
MSNFSCETTLDLTTTWLQCCTRPIDYARHTFFCCRILLKYLHSFIACRKSCLLRMTRGGLKRTYTQLSVSWRHLWLIPPIFTCPLFQPPPAPYYWYYDCHARESTQLHSELHRPHAWWVVQYKSSQTGMVMLHRNSKGVLHWRMRRIQQTSRGQIRRKVWFISLVNMNLPIEDANTNNYLCLQRGSRMISEVRFLAL